MKRILYACLAVVMLLMLTSCKPKHANILFDNAGFTVENMPEWTMEINYIAETRGKAERVYTQLSGSNASESGFFDMVNMLYSAEKVDPPDNYLFSAEAMCQNRLDLYHLSEEEPSVSLYYFKDSNVLIHLNRHDEKDVEAIDYTFYRPAGDIASLINEKRSIAITPQQKTADLFMSPEELKASISDEELEKLLEVNFEDALSFDFFTGELPDAMGTSSQIFSTRTFAQVPPENYLIVARTANEIGEALDLGIIGFQYSDMFTKVLVSYPDLELNEELGLTVDNAILVDRADVPTQKPIVFIDEDSKIVDVIVPSVMLD